MCVCYQQPGSSVWPVGRIFLMPETLSNNVNFYNEFLFVIHCILEISIAFLKPKFGSNHF